MWLAHAVNHGSRFLAIAESTTKAELRTARGTRVSESVSAVQATTERHKKFLAVDKLSSNAYNGNR